MVRLAERQGCAEVCQAGRAHGRCCGASVVGRCAQLCAHAWMFRHPPGVSQRAGRSCDMRQLQRKGSMGEPNSPQTFILTPTSPTHPPTHPQKHPQHTPPPPLHTTHHLPVCHCTTHTTPWSHKVTPLPHPPTHPPAQTHADLREHDPVYDGEGARAAGAAGQVALAQVGCVHSYAFFYVFVVCL